MTRTRTIRTKTGATVAAIGVAALVAACGSSHSAPSSSASSGSSGSSGAAVSGTPVSDKTLQISVVSGHAGHYLAGANGKAIYLWVADGHDKSHCSGACAQEWPLVLTKSKPTAGHGVKAGDLGTIAHGSEREVTYNGHPLYYFAGDSARGMTKGQGSNGFGAKWWLVSPAGAAITSSGGSSGTSGGSGSGSSSTTTSSSSSAGGGWG